MAHVLITGLENQGPGDILGAIGGETNIDPKRIGNIDINNSKALVEVGDDFGDKLAKQLDGKRVGRSEVSVEPVGKEELKKIKKIESYVDKYLRLVELERKEEMREHEESIRKLTGKQRELEGKAILNLRGRDEGNALEGQLVKFMRQRRGEPLPETEISVGDLVMLSRKDPLRDDNPTATVIQKTGYSITAAFENPRDFIFGKNLRMDLYVNDITYQRMKSALQQMRDAGGRLTELRDVLTGLQPPAKTAKAELIKWFNQSLNDSQKEAVAYSIGSKDFYLIHGPPGTGKTTSAIEVIQQAVADGQKVLATAASNTAVDNILEFLLSQNAKAVRVGHPARVTPQLKEHTLDSLVQQNQKYRESEVLRERAFSKKDEQDEYTHPSGRYRRGMSDNKINKLAEQGRGSRGVPADKIQEMSKWLELQNEIDELFEKADALRDEAVEEVLSDKQVICTTNNTSGSELMDGLEFDLVVIDEATQATEPSCLIPITHARKVVMAGDHKQLPPTVKNRQAAVQGLEYTLFERLAEKYPPKKNMLKIQYRMHEKIMGFSSREFYNNSLEAHNSVKNHTLADFDIEAKSFDEEAVDILAPEEPIVFLNTDRLEARERSRKGSTSKENPEEARLVKKLVDELLYSGIKSEDIAVISPYNDQVDLLQQMIDAEHLEIKSVDGFQGREKEAVIISLTRSNTDGDIGFLKDVRRLNVALTRAKRKLIVVGDRLTVSSHNTYKHLLEYVRENGKIYHSKQQADIGYID